MTTSRRAPARRDVKSRRRTFMRSLPQRRIGQMEALEPRALLAADAGIFVSNYWNYKNPTDVNADGRVSTLDILAVVNALTDGGVRHVAGRTVGPAGAATGGQTSEPASTLSAEGELAATGETTAGQTYFVDSNNDGLLNMLDLLAIVNDMTAEGEGEPPLVRFRVEPVKAGTVTPLPTNAQGKYLISEGDYYELRVLVQDTGVLQFGQLTRPAQFDPDGPGGSPPKTALGVSTAFLDMDWDTSKTGILVTETQTVDIAGSPTGIEISATNHTQFKLTFNGVTTANIDYSLVPAFTARNIRDALVTALGSQGRTQISNLRNVEVDPVSATSFKVRFINDLGNQDFAAMSSTLTKAAGATGVTITTNVDGNPNSAVSFREMFRGRTVRDQENSSLPILNNPQFFDTTEQPPFINGDRTATGFNDAGSVSRIAANLSADRPGTELVEVFRLRMKATDGDGVTPVTFQGSVEDLNIDNFFVTVYGFNPIIPANLVTFDAAPQLLITEPVSAVADTATVNEGTGANVLIPVLANDIDGTGASNLQIVSPLPTLDPSQGTIAIVGSQIRYTVPNADFNGVVTFQYVIRDGANASLTDTGTVTVTVKATNDAPVNSVPAATQTISEDQAGGLVFSAGTGNAITINDIDAGSSNVRVTLTATGGVLALNPLAVAGLTSVTGDGTGSIVATGSLVNLNAALSGLRYTPNLNFNGAATLTVQTSDLGSSQDASITPQVIGTDTDVVNINVTAVNDAPVNTAPTPRQVDEGLALSFTSGNSLSVADVDAGETAGTNKVRVTLTTNSTQGGTLTATAAGGAVVTGSGSQSVQIEGPLAAVNSTLQSLMFHAGLPETVTLNMLTSDLGNTGTPGALTDSDNVVITVVATVRPRATPDTFNVTEGPATFELNVRSGDLANAGANVTLESVGAPTVGTTSIDTKGTPTKTDDTVIYTPPANFFGTVTFSYTISEDPVTGATVIGANNTAIVTVNIANAPDVPVAVADAYAATEDVLLTVNVASGVLANDTDADNLTPPLNAGLTAVLTQQPPAGQGTVALAANGSFTWTPPAGLNFAGPTTTFKYQARDAEGNLSPEATVTINIAAVNDAPVAVDDGPGGIFQTTEDNLLSIPVPGVLANDTDVDSPAGQLTVAVTQAPPASQGTVVLQGNGAFLFTPAQDFNGTASFKYRVFDNDPTNPQQSGEATVRITVLSVNDAPVAGDTSFTVEEGQVLTISAAQGLRTLVTDADQPGGFTGIINLESGPAQGTLNLATDGSFSYTPPATVVTNFDVTFTYSAFDGTVSSNVGTVTIHVTPFNDPPVAGQDGPYATNEDAPLSIAAPGLLANDNDEETPTASLQAQLVSGVPVAAGNVVVNADGSFLYTPAQDFFGATSFTYRAFDGGKTSNVITVSINVVEQNDAPIANDDAANPVVKDIPNQVITPSPLANDSSGPDAGVPGEALSILSVPATSAQGGTLTLSGGQILYTPAAGFIGSDSFVYTLSDGRGGTDTATVSFTVLDFVPKTVSGKVFFDKNDNGVFEPANGENGLAGVRVDLTGTNVLGAFAAFVLTDLNGDYSFSNLAPGSYTLTETQPLYFTSGKEGVHTSPLTADSVTNANLLDNTMGVSWTPLDFDGNITGLDFGERGIDTSSLADATGFLGEILTSSSQNGMIFSVDLAGQMDWSYCLNGWNTTASCQLEPIAGGAIPSLRLTIGGVTRRIYQDPSNNHGVDSPAAGSLARFRILGTSSTGDYIIRIDGTLSECGFVAAAAVPEAGEGESAAAMSDAEFRQAADEVFRDQAWA